MPRIPVSWILSTLVTLSPIFWLTALLSVYAGINRWTSNGPNLPLVQTLAIAPTDSQIVYAGTDRGLFKSINGGMDWN
jgi:hypothetical protein